MKKAKTVLVWSAMVALCVAAAILVTVIVAAAFAQSLGTGIAVLAVTTSPLLLLWAASVLSKGE